MARLSVLFLYTLSLALILPSLLAALPLLFFAPFLVHSFYRQEKIPCLWLAFLCGLIIDLLSSQMPLGFYALNYILTVELLYPYKRNFFEDSLSTLPILTCLFSALFTVLQVMLLYGFGQGVILSWPWLKTDLIGMPLVDALYALFAFSIPSLLLPRLLPRRHFKRRSRFILQRETKL